MNYHISTALILQEFPKTDSECPLCEIRAIVEKNVTEQFLGEAVMSTDARYKVNERGFCSKHFAMLYEGQSKLGLALQCVTRMNVLKRYLSVKRRGAKKAAASIAAATRTCIICDTVEDHMQRYYKTVAQLYAAEEDFRDLIAYTKGFCLDDYAGLLANSGCAGTKAGDYVDKLAAVETENFGRVQAELQSFCDSHDFRRGGRDLGASKDSLRRAGIKIYGKKNP